MKKKLRMPLKAVLISACFLASLTLVYSPVSGHSLNSPPLLNASNGIATESKSAEITVSGKVTDDANQPVPGVNILLKGTTTGTTSDANGAYTLTVPDENGVLVFSFIGYATQEVSINNRSVIDVSLVSDAVALSEIVVTGYTTQSKRDITGAVAIISSDQLLTTPSTNLGQALQGKVAGVTVGNENSPGGGVMVRIRGFGTINDNSPLYVIDGVPTKGNLNTLNLNDIESMQILKDASSASIYGSRAGNGVVIVTTKKGKVGKPIFTYDMYIGQQQPGKFLDLLNTEEYANLTWQARINAGAVSSTNGNPVHAQFGNGPTPTIPDYIFPAGAMEGDPRVAQDAQGNYINYSSNIDDPNFNKTKWMIT